MRRRCYATTRRSLAIVGVLDRIKYEANIAGWAASKASSRERSWSLPFPFSTSRGLHFLAKCGAYEHTPYQVRSPQAPARGDHTATTHRVRLYWHLCGELDIYVTFTTI